MESEETVKAPEARSAAPAVRVEPARPSDLDEIVAIEREAFATPWSREAFESEFDGNAFSHILVARCPAESEGRLIGYCCFWIVFEELRLLTFAVRLANRRQGVGARLLARALDEGARHGATRALLEVRASNFEAQAFYRGFGFRVYGRRAGYYTNPVEDAILMTLDPLLPSGTAGCDETAGLR